MSHYVSKKIKCFAIFVKTICSDYMHHKAQRQGIKYLLSPCFINRFQRALQGGFFIHF